MQKLLANARFFPVRHDSCCLDHRKDLTDFADTSTNVYWRSFWPGNCGLILITDFHTTDGFKNGCGSHAL